MISGTGSVQQNGSGTTILTGDNTYTGVTTINAGTLQLGNGGTSGSITGDIINKGILAFDRSNVLVFGGTISGAGSVQQIGSGTTILIGNNTYTGVTTISAGTLQVGNGGTTGTVSNSVIDNGTLVSDRSDSVNFGGTISGTGNLFKLGGATLTLSGTNSYAGTTSVNAGVLQAGSTSAFSPTSAFIFNVGAVLDLNGNDSTVGSLSGAGFVTSGAFQPFFNARLTVGGNDASTTFSGLLEDGVVIPPSMASRLALNKVGTGTLILTGNNTYSGGTTISAGTLQLGNGGATGNIAGNVIDNGILAFNRSDSFTFSGLISGSGNVQQNGTGATILTANNSYAGGTTISAGTLQLGNGRTTGNIVGKVIDNGILAFDRSDVLTFGGAISGHGRRQSDWDRHDHPDR